MSVYDYGCPDLELDAGGLRERHPPPPTHSVLFRGPPGLTGERAGKTHPTRRCGTNPTCDESAAKANAISDNKKEGSVVLQAVQSTSGVLDVVLSDVFK